MPTKLKVGASQTMAGNEHGSHSASINLEIELDPNLLTDSIKLQERIRELFALVRQALAEELAGRTSASAKSLDQPTSPGPPLNGHKPTNGRHFGGTRFATPAQIKALFGITRRQGIHLRDFIRSRCGVDRPEDLTLDQASELIDALTSEKESTT